MKAKCSKRPLFDGTALRDKSVLKKYLNLGATLKKESRNILGRRMEVFVLHSEIGGIWKVRVCPTAAMSLAMDCFEVIAGDPARFKSLIVESQILEENRKRVA